MMDWFTHVSIAGLPRWAVIAIGTYMVTEAALGRVKNPKLRSFLMVVAHLLGWAFTFATGKTAAVVARVMANKPQDPPDPPAPPTATAPVTVLLLAALTAGACAHPPTPPIVGGVIECGAAAVKETAINILPAVSSALASGDWEDALIRLVVRFGEEAVDCATQRIGGEAAADAQMARTDALAPLKAERARRWLESRQVSFRGAQ